MLFWLYKPYKLVPADQGFNIRSLQAEQQMEAANRVINSLRGLRAQYGLARQKPAVRLDVSTAEAAADLEAAAGAIATLSLSSTVTIQRVSPPSLCLTSEGTKELLHGLIRRSAGADPSNRGVCGTAATDQMARRCVCWSPSDGNEIGLSRKYNNLTAQHPHCSYLQPQDIVPSTLSDRDIGVICRTAARRRGNPVLWSWIPAPRHTWT